MPEIEDGKEFGNFKLTYDNNNVLCTCFISTFGMEYQNPNYYTELMYGFYDLNSNKWVLEQIGRSKKNDAGYGGYLHFQFDSFNNPHIAYLDAYIIFTSTEYHNGGLLYSRKGTLVENDRPEVPEKPGGKAFYKHKEKCSFSAVTSDPEGDRIQYGWDWDNDKEVDEWTDFYESGETVEAIHKWYVQDSFTKKVGVRVKSMDEHGAESDWSEPLDITVILSRSRSIFDRFFQLFPNIAQLLEMFLHL